MPSCLAPVSGAWNARGYGVGSSPNLLLAGCRSAASRPADARLGAPRPLTSAARRLGFLATSSERSRSRRPCGAFPPDPGSPGDEFHVHRAR